MATKEKFQIQPSVETSPLSKRLARTIGRSALEEQQRQHGREKLIAQLQDKVSKLDMTEQGNGANKLNALLLENAETGNPPMIFIKTSEKPRDAVDVAFGDKDFSGKNIVAVNDEAQIGQYELKQLQTAYPDGLTVVGRDSGLAINYADYEQLLRPTDAVVALHEAPKEPVAHIEQQ